MSSEKLGGLGGRKERNERLHEERRGSGSASSHVDFLILIRALYGFSEEQAKSRGGNTSPYPLAAIPLLVSMLRALVIDCEICSMKAKRDFDCLKRGDDLAAILDRFEIDSDLRRDAVYLQEIRNEIIHPTHAAIEEKDHWPEYLRYIKDRGLLNSTGGKDSDYDFFHQLHSHRLFDWSLNVTVEIARKIFFSYQGEPGWMGLKRLWQNFEPEKD